MTGWGGAGGDLASDPDAPGLDAVRSAIVRGVPPALWAHSGYPDPCHFQK